MSAKPAAPRAAFDTGPLSWVKSEIDLALQRALASLEGGSEKDALANLHQAAGALQIVGLDGVTRVMEELEALLSDLAKGSLAASAEQRALAGRGISGIAGYLDQLMTGAANQPLRLLPLYRELLGAREPARAVDAVDLYFPNLGYRPPRREKVPVALHPEEAVRYFREQRVRYQRGFVAWLKNDAGGLADMQAAVAAIELTQGPTAQRAFWWAAVAFFDALVRGALPQDLDARRMCNRIESQIRRLADGSQNVAERLLRETLYCVAQARPASEAIREVQETFRLADTLPQDTAAPAEVPPAALRAARDLLAQAKGDWNRFATGHPSALSAFNKAAGPLAQRSAELGQPALAALAARIAEVGEWAARDSAGMNEAVGLEQAVALLLAEHALERLAEGRLAAGDAEFAEQSAFVCERLAMGIEGRLLRTAPGVALLDDMSRQAQERLMVSQVVGEMQVSLRAVEAALDEFFRDPNKRARLATLDQPLTQLVGALDVLGATRARATLEATVAEIARVADPHHVPQQSEFEAIAQTLSGLGFYVEALAHGEADFDAIMRPLGALQAGSDQGEPSDSTVEAQLAGLQEKAQALFEQWQQQPSDARLKAELQKELGAIQQDAGLIADAELEAKAAAALKLVAGAALPLAPELAQAVHGLAPVVAAGAAMSDDAARLLDASTESVDSELLSVYLEEANEVLAAVAGNLALLRQRTTDASVLTAIRRGFHTLKGSGRMVGLTRLGDVAWLVEKTLNQWLQEELPASDELLQMIEAAQRYFSEAVANLKAGAPVPGDAALRALVEGVRSRLPAAGMEAQGPLAQSPDAGVSAGAVVEVAGAVESSAASSAEAATPQRPAVDATVAEDGHVLLGEHKVSATVFTLFSGEAHALLHTIREEHETLRQHGIISDVMLRATHTLAGIAGTVRLDVLRELARAFEAALTRLSVEALSTDEEALVSDAIEALDAMVSSAVHLRVPAAQALLLARLQGALAASAALSSGHVEFHRDTEGGILPEEEAALPRGDEAPQPIALVTREAQVLPVADPGPAAPAASHAGIERRQQRPGDELDVQLLAVFTEEAADLMPAIGTALRGWRAVPEPRDAGRTLQRLLHTFKGGARMAGAMGLGELTHNMESRIESALAQPALPATLFDDLESAFDRVGLLLDQLTAGAAADGPEAIPASATAPNDAAPLPVREGETARAMLRVRADLIDRLVNEAGEVSIARSRIEGELRSLKASMQELTDNVMRLRGQLREIEIQAESQMQARSADTRGKEGFDPLEFDRFTRFQELTRLMAESVNDVQTVHQSLLLAANSTESALATQARLNRDLQQDLMRVRMVPFSSLAERLYRIVRQTAKDTGKRANLDIRGGAIELDRSVLERITAPFEHLLRNAVSHGIEVPAARAAAGKPEMGDIRIEVSQEGNEVRLTISDDGAGLDLAGIRAKALALGALKPNDTPSDAEVADLIFLQGLSTAQALTQVAGRGIGMDVVRTETAALGGRVEVDFTPGKGSRFTIFLPLTLAMTQAVIVRAGTQSFAVPSVMVEHVGQFWPEQIEAARRDRAVVWQERRRVFHDLPELLGMEAAPVGRRHQASVMFLKSGSSTVALHVDDITGSNQEIVVKALGPQLQRLPGIAGATVLGSGEIALIINPVLLAQQHTLREAERRLGAGAVIAAPSAAHEPPPPPIVMVVDDSLTVRKFTGRLLERQGYALMVARDGVEALEKLREVLPDVMLVDIEMPRMDGFDLTRNVRADPRLAHIPIVIISSRTADKHRNHAGELGVNAFLGKPYPEEELLALIARLVKKAPG